MVKRFKKTFVLFALQACKGQTQYCISKFEPSVLFRFEAILRRHCLLKWKVTCQKTVEDKFCVETVELSIRKQNSEHFAESKSEGKSFSHM